MGTRNLTVVKLNDKTKVAQYGQWDGYPTGQGQEIADFIKEHLLTAEKLNSFKKKVNTLIEFKLDKQYLKDKKEIFGDEYEEEFVSSNKINKLNEKYPTLSRDHGAGILRLIEDGTVKSVVLNEDFKKDDIFCEYCYEINLDNETVSVNDGKNYTFKEWTKKDLMKKIEKSE